MRRAKSILALVIAVVLAAYASDCSALANPEQAMQCCQSMPCSSHGQSADDCCSSMQPHLAPFVQSTPIHPSPVGFVAFTTPSANDPSPQLNLASGLIAAQSHAPPGIYSPAPLPLRI